MEPITVDQLLNMPPAIDVETAARALGIGRTKAYELAKNGDFPCTVIRVGQSYRVPLADLLGLLGIQLRQEAS